MSRSTTPAWTWSRSRLPFTGSTSTSFIAKSSVCSNPDGILAAWTYSFPEISPEIDPLIHHYYGEILAGYWPERIHYLEEEYKTIPFPFEEIVPPSFVMEVNWNLIQFAGFLDSWSATQRYKAQKGHHPLEIIWDQLLAAWGDENEPRLVRWPLHFRIGRNRYMPEFPTNLLFSTSLRSHDVIW